jgi:hypothetical protein
MREDRPQPSKRNPLLIQFAAAAAILVILAGVSVWVIRTYVMPAGLVVLLPPPARPNRLGVAIAPAGPTISGMVVDARTHKPIADFTAQIGYSFPGQLSWFGNESPQSFHDGQYKVTSRVNVVGHGVTWRVRVEARGYLPAVSPRLGAHAAHNFQLQPGHDLQGRVLQADGRPAAHATVALVLPGQLLFVLNGEFAPQQTPRSNAQAQIVTGPDGQYDFPPQSGHFLLVALSDQGIVQADQNALAKSTHIRLVPWGGVRGQLRIETQTGADQQIVVSGPHTFAADAPAVGFYSQTQTGPDGRFRLDHLPPGPMQICRQVRERFGSTTLGVDTLDTPVTIPAGRTITVNLGGAGRPVIGRLALPADATNPAGYDIDAAAVAVAGGPPARYQLQFGSNENFRIDDVLPGTYRVMVNFSISGNKGRVLHGSAKFTMPPIPGGVSGQPLKIPDIVMKPPAGAAGK